MKFSALFAGCLFAAVVATPAAAQKSVYTAVLNGSGEAPANASPGVGSATVTIDSEGGVKVAWVELAGPDGSLGTWLVSPLHIFIAAQRCLILAQRVWRPRHQHLRIFRPA